MKKQIKKWIGILMIALPIMAGIILLLISEGWKILAVMFGSILLVMWLGYGAFLIDDNK